MLNVLSASASSRCAASHTNLAMGGTGHVPRSTSASQLFGQRAVQVLGDAAARDVRQRAHGAGAGVQHGAHGLHVDARGREQRVLQAGAVQLLALEAQLVVGLALHAHLAGERVAVGVQAARRQADQHVALAHGRGIEHLRPVHHAHAEAGQVVVVRVHHAGVLGHLAADERAAGLLAALADARHDLGHVLGLELADGHVVQEEQRLGARGQDVVRAHGHQVDAHRVVLAGQLGHLELRAHAVGAAHQQRVVHVLGRRDGEQAAEAADVAHHLGPVRVVHHALDGVHGARALGGVDARLRVGRGLLVHPAGHRGGVVGSGGAHG